MKAGVQVLQNDSLQFDRKKLEILWLTLSSRSIQQDVSGIYIVLSA